MSCGTCPDSAQPTTRQDGTAPTPGSLLWSADVGAWYRRQRAQGQRPAVNLPAAAPPAPVFASAYDALDWAKEHGPSDESRAAVCQQPGCAYFYALMVDRGPHPNTRAAACQRARFAACYAEMIDRGPRDDTRQAACQEAQQAFYYARAVDRGPHPDTWAACKKSQSRRWGRPAYEREIGRPV